MEANFMKNDSFYVLIRSLQNSTHVAVHI